MSRTCKVCGLTKPLDAEHFYPTGVNTFRWRCIDCRVGWRRAYNRTDRHKARQKVHNANYRLNNETIIKLARQRCPDRFKNDKQFRARGVRWARRQRRNRKAEEAAERKANLSFILRRAEHKHRMKTKYNTTQERYFEMFNAQGCCCAICKTKFPRKNVKDDYSWAVDHDHKTGEVRGLLCSICNLGLGHFKDRPDILRAAINYLLKVNSGAIRE